MNQLYLVILLFSMNLKSLTLLWWSLGSRSHLILSLDFEIDYQRLKLIWYEFWTSWGLKRRNLTHTEQCETEDTACRIAAHQVKQRSGVLVEWKGWKIQTITSLRFFKNLTGCGLLTSEQALRKQFNKTLYKMQVLSESYRNNPVDSLLIYAAL